MRHLTTSLVLSSYNGEQYIVNQLDSLREQIIPIDEVLICDDCSSDSTPSIIRDYIKRFNLTHWKLEVNEHNKGWKKNFRELIFQASGDLIFLCDQDDIWSCEKISKMVGLMESHPEIDLIACEVEPFYEKGSKQIPNVSKGNDDGTLSMHGIDYKAVYVLRPGCTYCVRKDFVDEIKLFWPDEWAHDAVLWELAETKGTLALYSKRLVKYRRHASNASARTKLTRKERIRDIEHLVERVNLMRRFGEEKEYLTEKDKQMLACIENWLRARISMLDSRGLKSLKKVIKGHYFYATNKGLPYDLYLALLKSGNR